MLAHKYVIKFNITMSHTGSALLVAINNVNPICELVLLYNVQTVVGTFIEL